jgi:GDPmannose 4,6-dehydratase
MKSEKVVIFGIAGQDGSYLAEYLVNLGYKVYGAVRRQSTPEHQESRLDELLNKKLIETRYADLLDTPSVEKILTEVQPDQIYNLAAQSHVRISFDIPSFTAQVNGIGVLNLLESFRKICPHAKFYQASSSEMFGNSVDTDKFQRETTPMKPVSPYGCAKLFAFNICNNYKNSYKLHICNGILFNHESPRRASNFVSNKIIKAAVKIKLGQQDKLELGNMDSYRDWGHSKDYVKAMYMIMNHETPKNWVVSTQQCHSVRDMCEYVFNKVDLNYTDYVIQNEKFLRPEELKYLKGDSTPIRDELGWKPEYTFEEMLDEMIDHWMNVLSRS